MSTQPRSSSGGVRNLRAMFEQKDESSTSPPDRGRSPAGSYGGGSNNASPRPLSKVRTSFITVEKSGQFGGQLGLRMSNEADHSQGKRRTSFSIDEETDSPATDGKPSVKSDVNVKKKNIGMRDAVPEHAITATPPLESTRKTGYMNGHGVNGSESTAKTNGSAEKNPEKKGTSTVSATAPTPVVSVKPSSPIKSPSKASPTKGTTNPAPISTAKASASSKSFSAGKSPTTQKTPTTPGTSGKPVSSRTTASKSTENKSPERKVVKPIKNPEAMKPAARLSIAASIGSKAKRLAPVTSANGFVKPRPKSPTKPAKLPASLTTHTASSQSKVSSGSTPPRRQSLAPNAAAKPGLKIVSRSPSLVNLAPKAELRRTKSSIHSDRPALGRPPSSRDHSSRQSLPRQSVPADEGFLARMMRPTTSSASKVLEKTLTSPTERAKSDTRPQTRDSAASHKTDEGLTASPSTKNLPHVPKIAEVEAPKMAKLEPVKPVTVVTETASKSSDSKSAHGLEDVAKASAETATAVEEKITNRSTLLGEDLEDVTPSRNTTFPKVDSSISEEQKPEGAASVVKEGSVSEPDVPINEDKVEAAEITKLEGPKEIKKEELGSDGDNEDAAKDVDRVEENTAESEPTAASDGKVEVQETGEEPDRETSG